MAVSKLILGIFRLKDKRTIVTSPHFWMVLAITLALIFLYQAWPWRTGYVWQQFPWPSFLFDLAVMEFVNHTVGLLFLVPIIYAAVVFSWPGALVACLLSFGGILPIIVGTWSIDAMITNIAVLMLPFMIVSLVTFELEWHRKERRIFAEREEERRIYTSKLLCIQENERKRIAQELHDETIQTLLVIANRTQNLFSSGDGDIEEAKRNVEWIRDATLQTAEDLRRVSLDLRPCILDDLGLVSALRWLVDRMGEESDINVRILENGVERKLSPEAEVTIFRIVQEALNNVKRHSKATEVIVTLEFSAERLKIEIKDNGQGFHSVRKFSNLAAKGKLGLIGMRERIESLNGTLEIRSRLGKGTSILIEAKR
jgi:two-component system sensor histidine kinase DegS